MLVLIGAGLMVGLVTVAARRYLTGWESLVAAVGLPLRLSYVGVLSIIGVVADPGLRQPGIVYVVGPV